MKARSETEPWVSSLRTFIRDALGNSWQVKDKGGATNLRIRLDDGTRVYRNLGLPWCKASASSIRESVEEIHDLVIHKNISVNEAVERVKQTRSKTPEAARRANPKLLISAWENYANYKVNVSGDVSPKTWQIEYGKTFRKLKQVAAANATELLIEIGKSYEPGSRSRQIRVQHIEAFLRWATSRA